MSDAPAATAYVKSQQHITLGAAELVLAAAVERAESLGVAAVIIVTDANGGITSLARLDGAPPIAIRHALAKAGSASGMKRATDDFVDQRLTTDDVLWRAISGRSDAFVVHGGFPLTIDGKVAGAIGVATAQHEHDSEIGRAGVAALDAMLTAGP